PNPELVAAQAARHGLVGAKPAMSAMGRLAAAKARQMSGVAQKSDDTCLNTPDCPDEDNPFVDPDGPNGGNQAETSVAITPDGQHVVIGVNDFRGFANNPISVSGFMYSDDGGKTFVDGGQLPSPGTDIVAGTKFPEVFGDPDVKFVAPPCTFI